MGERPFASFDFEFDSSSLESDVSGVWSGQFWGRDFEVYVRSPVELVDVLLRLADGHYFVYGYNMLCDIGAAQTWLHSALCGLDCRSPSHCRLWWTKQVDVDNIASLRFDANRSVTFLDVQDLGRAMGRSNLDGLGKLVGVPKLPDESVCARLVIDGKCPNKAFPCGKDSIRWNCRTYAMNDAQITFEFGELMRLKFGLNPSKVRTAGEIALHYFPLPKRDLRLPHEERLASGMAAGRTEVFRNGYASEVWINDFGSLYPVSMIESGAFRIGGIESCGIDDIELGSVEGQGWYCDPIVVVPDSSDLWGLPVSVDGINRYVVGRIEGSPVYHSFDVSASKGTVVSARRCFRPLWTDTNAEIELDYRERLIARLSGGLKDEDAALWKTAMNVAKGLFEKTKPIASKYLNQPAGSAVYAYSHWEMSKRMDQYVSSGGVLCAMDTDSLIGDRKFEISDMIDGVPHLFRVTTFKSDKDGVKREAHGEAVFIRPKMYSIRTVDGSVKRATAGWRYHSRDFDQVWDHPKEMTVSKEVKRTMKTLIIRAKMLRLGGWLDIPNTLTDENIHRLLRADHRRVRPNYDSWQLFLEGRSEGSQAHRLGSG